MRVAINLVKDNTVDACVSAGNTGALMAISRFVLKTINGISRPAIMGRMPTMDGHTHMLDLGANVDSGPKALVEFAVMGSIAVKYTENINSPTVGLLNIGEEEMKGNENIKKTSELLKASNLNYIGFIEGDDIYKGSVDLVVCDGFNHNTA
jgi:glycerol-3-phosphate acyltransferase PlsX